MNVVGISRIVMRASATCVERDRVYATCINPLSHKIEIFLFDSISAEPTKIGYLEGFRSYLIKQIGGKLFVGADNKLIMNDSDGMWKTVLESKNTSNFFWHMASAGDGPLYVQEYGEPPTGIYESFDGKNWNLLVTSTDIDKCARHFHNLTYDPYRDWLIATLGDGNHVRAAVSANHGRTWKPVRKCKWQVLPTAVLEDQIVFGMDSGIALGGVVTWFTSNDRFEVKHLKWCKGALGRAEKNMAVQMADMCLIPEGRWIWTLGTPQAILVSKGFDEFWPIYVEGFRESFSHSMSIGVGENLLSFTTGKSLMVVEKRTLQKDVNMTEKCICQHRALKERLINTGRIVKWSFLSGRKTVDDRQ
jgi:hypothetical protein